MVQLAYSPIRRTGGLMLALALCALPVFIDPGAVARVNSLLPLAFSANPYFAPAHGLLLYGWSPLVVVSGCILLLAPGLMLALAFGAGRTAAQWVLAASGLSLAVVSLAATLLQLLIAAPLQGPAFALMLAGLTLAATPLAAARLRQGATWPLDSAHAWPTLASMALVPALFLIVLTPKFYWENFNADGVHSYETARLLLTQALPFWPAGTGPLGSFPGTKTLLSVYPASWFIRLFGGGEASARLPYLLSMAALYAGMLSLVEHGRPQAPGRTERRLLWIGLLIFSLVMAFSANEEP